MKITEIFRLEFANANKAMYARNLVEAKNIYSKLYEFISINTYRQRLNKKYFNKVFFGLTSNDVLVMLYNKMLCHLNSCELEQVLKTIHIYRQIEKDFDINNLLDENIDFYEIVSYYHIGEYQKALDLCDKMLKKDLVSSVKVEVLILKGSIETDESRQIFSINTLSLALAEAEAVGKPTLIAKCYIEMAKMIGIHYPSLSLSFLWKALIFYEKGQDKEHVSITKSRMALAYFNLWHRKKGNRFIEEARRLVNKDIMREDFVLSGAKYDFDRIKGLITNDVNLLESSIDEFESIHAYSEVLRSAELYIKTCLEIGDREAAKRGAKRYEQAAVAVNDEMRLNYIRSIDLDVLKPSWIPEQKQKTLPDLLDILEYLAYVEEWFHLEKEPIRALYPTHYQEGMFSAVMFSDGKARLYPCGLYPNRYFRGQSDKLEGLACKPSIFRNLTKEEMFRERLCLKELENLLQYYPLTKIFGMLSYNTPEGQKPISLKVDYTALAQHYGIKTDVLDLTVDKWIAAFFASTVYKNGEYLPFESEGEGVFYVYEPFPVFDEASDRLSAVGLQPLSRPGCQAGLVYKMLEDEDFNHIAKRIVFKHDPAIAELIFNYCNRSKKLFPNEIIEEKVNEIRKSKVYSQWALKNTLSTYYKDTNEDVIQGYIDKLGITFQDSPPIYFTKQEYTAILEKWDKEKEHFFDSIDIRLNFINKKQKMDSNCADGSPID